MSRHRGNIVARLPFPTAARRELADPQLRANLRRATHTIRDKRLRVVGEVPDWEALRVAGAAIKDDVLARLPELLEQFEAAATAAGATVHWARDAEEACAVVTGLVQADRHRRGGQGQVDGHPGDRPQRGARGGRHRTPWRPTWPS